MPRRIYLDHHATTPCDPRVVAAMLPTFTETFGNAASVNHAYGWEATQRVERARQQVAALIGASPKEIVFTSGATEAINLALKGLVEASPSRRHLITGATEHPAVLDTCAALVPRGARVTVLPVRPDGRVLAGDVAAALADDTLAVCLMAANNEIGVLHPLAEIGALCRDAGVHLVTDATQAAGKVPFDVAALGVSLAALSAHKLYGPKGVGALYVSRRRPRVRLAPQLHGGGLRSGTLNVSGIVGFGAACELAAAEGAADGARLAALRDHLWAGLQAQLSDVHLNGSLTERLPHNLNVSFAGVEGEPLLMALDGIAVSSGSACTSATLEPSHVLRALGIGEALAHGSLRFGLGRWTTREEIDETLARVVDAVTRLRAGSPARR
jgi:cysteine desulfurase